MPKFDYGVEVEWKTWRIGIEVSLEIQEWQPYLSLDLGPVHMWLARRKPWPYQ